VAVTVLTSLNQRALQEIGVERPVESQVVAMARLAEACGIGGVVGSPQEIRVIRGAAARGFGIVTAGVRRAGGVPDDQRRHAARREAVDVGADFIVVGRAVTAATDPRAALEELMISL